MTSHPADASADGGGATVALRVPGRADTLHGRGLSPFRAPALMAQARGARLTTSRHPADEIEARMRRGSRAKLTRESPTQHRCKFNRPRGVLTTATGPSGGRAARQFDAARRHKPRAGRVPAAELRKRPRKSRSGLPARRSPCEHESSNTIPASSDRLGPISHHNCLLRGLWRPYLTRNTSGHS